MATQFSQDDDIANEGAIVHVWVISIAPEESTAAVQRLSALMQDTIANFPGFLGGEVLEADDQRSILAISHWTSRHLWAKAQWNREVGQTLSALFKSATQMVDSMYYVRSVTRNTKGPHP